jgi:hypothetical protein
MCYNNFIKSINGGRNMENKLHRKAYEKPVLERCGPVNELTLGVGGSNWDPGHANNTKRGT